MMEFIDLKAQQDCIRSELDRRIQAVLKHNQYIMGPEVAELEKCLADYVGVKHCVTVASGTDALLIALMVAGVGPGDEVITTPFTFIANAETVAFLGAKPVFVDIDPKTYNIDPAKIAQAITPHTKAIIPVNLYGQCADYDGIESVLNQRPVIIEDAAQSFGATYKGRRSCSLSTIGCTSFFPSKPLGCYGDGGACFTNDDAQAQVMREIRVHGSDHRYHHVRVGANGRLDTLQAAVLLAKMTVFDDEVKNRERLGRNYSALLKDVTQVPFVESFNTHVYAQYTIRVNRRDRFQAILKEKGIPTSVHYPTPLHLQPVFAGLGYCEGDFPVSEKFAHEVVSLPLHPYLKDEEISLLTETTKNAIIS